MNDTERMSETVDRFCQFIATLPISSLVEQDWGPKEVLAHLVYHHELYVKLIEAFLSYAPLSPPEGTFRELNASAISLFKEMSPSDLVGRLQIANRRLVELYQIHNPDEIVIVIKAGAKPRTLRALIPEVEAHVRNYLHKLLGTSKQNSLSL